MQFFRHRKNLREYAARTQTVCKLIKYLRLGDKAVIFILRYSFTFQGSESLQEIRNADS
jgi:hypothetical protein